MKNRNLRLKDKILIYILPFVAVTLLIISFLAYYQAKQIFMSNYKLQKEQVEANIRSTMLAIDNGYAMLEINMEDELKQRILDFKREFENAGGEPEKISLDAVKARMGNEYDFVVIDSATTIVKSTIPDTLNFNFKNTNKILGAGIDDMRNSDSVHFERFSANPGTGYLSMFGYLSSSDHRYLLEVAHTEPELGSYVDGLKPVTMTSKLSKISPMIVSIRIFDVYGWEYTGKGTKKTATRESLAIVEKAKRENRFEVTDGDITKSYFYINLKKEGNYLSDNSKTVEIVYDTTQLMAELRRIAYTTLLAGLIAIAALIFSMFTLVKKTTYPITILTEAAKQVSKGDLRGFREESQPGRDRGAYRHFQFHDREDQRGF